MVGPGRLLRAESLLGNWNSGGCGGFFTYIMPRLGQLFKLTQKNGSIKFPSLRTLTRFPVYDIYSPTPMDFPGSRGGAIENVTCR